MPRWRAFMKPLVSLPAAEWATAMGKWPVTTHSASPTSATGSSPGLFGRPDESCEDAAWDPEPIEASDESQQKRFR